MTGVEEGAAAIAIVVAAGVFRGLTGYGFSLISALGLPYALDVEQAVCITLLLEVLTAAVMVQKSSFTQHVDRLTIALVASGLVGSFVGALLSGAIGRDLTALIMNVSLVVAASATFVRHPYAWLGGLPMGVIVGFTVAVLLAGFAVGGPLLIAWLISARMAPERARATMTIFFFVTAISAVVLRGIASTFPLTAVLLAVALAPAAVGGVALGKIAFRRMRTETWQRAVHGSLVVIASVGTLNVFFVLQKLEFAR